MYGSLRTYEGAFKDASDSSAAVWHRSPTSIPSTDLLIRQPSPLGATVSADLLIRQPSPFGAVVSADSVLQHPTSLRPSIPTNPMATSDLSDMRVATTASADPKAKKGDEKKGDE